MRAAWCSGFWFWTPSKASVLYLSKKLPCLVVVGSRKDWHKCQISSLNKYRLNQTSWLLLLWLLIVVAVDCNDSCCSILNVFIYVDQGNIRVFCRVRPLLGEELFGNTGEIQHMCFSDKDQKVIELEKLAEASLSEVRVTQINIWHYNGTITHLYRAA